MAVCFRKQQINMPRAGDGWMLEVPFPAATDHDNMPALSHASPQL